MAKFYDISAKITNELPTLKITDELVVTVNKRQKKTQEKRRNLP